MTWDEVFAVVRGEAAALLTDVSSDQLVPDASLAAMGANSLDRMDIVMTSQDELGISVPAADFAGVSSMRQLVDLLHSHCR